MNGPAIKGSKHVGKTAFGHSCSGLLSICFQNGNRICVINVFCERFEFQLVCCDVHLLVTFRVLIQLIEKMHQKGQGVLCLLFFYLRLESINPVI